MHDHRITPLTDADQLCQLSATQLVSAYRDRSLSPVDVTQAVLRRAEHVRADLNAFTFIDHVGALAAAQASERRWSDGTPLSPADGVPTTVKDLFSVRGWSVTYGSHTMGDYVAEEDSPSVARLRDAGAILIGLTTSSEFGWKAVTDSPRHGTTRNPWNPELTSGGSSGGAAVAAATGAGAFHLSTDGGGSIRVPAAFCGVVGLKPTYGRVPLYPASAFGTLSHLGPITRTVADTRTMLDIIAGPDPRDWLQGPVPLPPLTTSRRHLDGARIGVWAHPAGGLLDPAVTAAFTSVLDAVADAGAHLQPVQLPYPDLLDMFAVHWSAGAAARVSAVPETARAQLDPGLLALATTGQQLEVVRYVTTAVARAEVGRAMEQLAASYDYLLSPTTAVPPFAAGHDVPPGSGLTYWWEWAGFSFPLNLTQQPAVTIPWPTDSQPFGLQLVGVRGTDAALLDQAEALHRLANRSSAG